MSPPGPTDPRPDRPQARPIPGPTHPRPDRPQARPTPGPTDPRPEPRPDCRGAHTLGEIAAARDAFLGTPIGQIFFQKGVPKIGPSRRHQICIRNYVHPKRGVERDVPKGTLPKPSWSLNLTTVLYFAHVETPRSDPEGRSFFELFGDCASGGHLHLAAKNVSQGPPYFCAAAYPKMPPTRVLQKRSHKTYRSGLRRKAELVSHALETRISAPGPKILNVPAAAGRNRTAPSQGSHLRSGLSVTPRPVHCKLYYRFKREIPIFLHRFGTPF